MEHRCDEIVEEEELVILNDEVYGIKGFRG